MPLEDAHALLVGIARYQHVTDLSEAVLHDVSDLAALLVDPQQGGYAPGQVHLVPEPEATLDRLRHELADLAGRATSQSSVLIYFSGHGGRGTDGPGAGEYLLPVDARCESTAALEATALSGREFASAVAAISARKLVVVLDACHSGGVGELKAAGDVGFVPGLSEAYYHSLEAGRGRAILSSCRADEYAYVMPSARNSLFTQHLLNGLRGGASSDDGLIHICELYSYLQPRVSQEQPLQHPRFRADLEINFPVAMYPAGLRNPEPVDTQGYLYDAFISYVDQDPDATWVQQTLVPPLRAAGLRIALAGVSEDPGVPVVVGKERGITQSKRTIVVLSDAYLRDNAAMFEELLAQDVGLYDGTWRLIPIKFAELSRANLLPACL